MESQSVSEVRRVHIVYFLCRNGRIEHPHLIRLHHNSRNGIRLRDVKRWLGGLRGKDMADGFAWSYKRKYKTGYVWQDLVDEDLITPISDNEYVLKGSEITSRQDKDSSCTEEKVGKQKNQGESQSQYSEASSVYVSTKSSSEIEEESPTFGSETSTVTDDSGKIHATTEDDSKNKGRVHHSPALFLTLLRKKAKKRSSKVTSPEKISTPSGAAAAAAATADGDAGSSDNSPPDPNPTKSKNHSNGHANIFRNLITCGAVETNESAVVAINKQNSKPPHFLTMCITDARNVKSAELCYKDKLGGSQRVFENPAWIQQQCRCRNRKSFELREQRSASLVSNKAAANWPICSQCGKPFKPEKLHAHIRSCKGEKECVCGSDAGAAMSASQNTSKAPVESFSSGQSPLH